MACFCIVIACILNLDSYLIVSVFMFRAVVPSSGCTLESSGL